MQTGTSWDWRRRSSSIEVDCCTEHGEHQSPAGLCASGYKLPVSTAAAQSHDHCWFKTTVSRGSNGSCNELTGEILSRIELCGQTSYGFVYKSMIVVWGCGGYVEKGCVMTWLCPQSRLMVILYSFVVQSRSEMLFPSISMKQSMWPPVAVFWNNLSWIMESASQTTGYSRTTTPRPAPRGLLRNWSGIIALTGTLTWPESLRARVGLPCLASAGAVETDVTRINRQTECEHDEAWVGSAPGQWRLHAVLIFVRHAMCANVQDSWWAKM